MTKLKKDLGVVITNILDLDLYFYNFMMTKLKEDLK